MHNLSDTVDRKFTEVYDVSDWSVNSDTGWHSINDIKQTVEYQVYSLLLNDGTFLECADTHIVFDETLNEIFVKDLNSGDFVQTSTGPKEVLSVTKCPMFENMYDIGVSSLDHRFYSNGILSHNTTTAAGYLLWYAMFVPDSTVLIAAHKFTGAQEIMQRIRYAYENCPDYIKAGVTTYNKGSLDFENGSRIVSATTTENTGRGMSISLLYLDEFAFVRPSIAKEFWTSITPTLATGGKSIITSTPNSDEDQFALIWKQANKTVDTFGNQTDLGVNGYKAFSATWDEHPDRDQKWADEMRAKLGDDRFEREINLKFLVADETLINPNTLFALEGIEPVTKMGQIRWYSKPKKGNLYAIGLDPSLGTGGDPAAIQIFEANTTTQIGEWRHNKTDIPNQIKLMVEIIKYIVECTNEPNNIYYSIENNTIGEAALVSLNEYGEQNIPGSFISESGKKRRGFNTTQKTKLAACSKFKTLLESKKMSISSFGLISELKSFVANGGSYAAKIGETDDLVMASLLVVRILQQIGSYSYEVDNHMRDHEDLVAPMPFFAVFSSR